MQKEHSGLLNNNLNNLGELKNKVTEINGLKTQLENHRQQHVSLQNEHNGLLNNNLNILNNLGELQNERDSLKKDLEEKNQLIISLQNSLAEILSKQILPINAEPNIFDNLEIKTITKKVIFDDNGEIQKIEYNQ